MEELKNTPDSLILGVRSFKGKDIPWKSRIGNTLTRKVFSYITGIYISDTQTGLRGIPKTFIYELLDIPGERFEFETQMLIETVGKYKIKEVEIETVYDSKTNHQTHFNPLLDSIKIYKIFLKSLLNMH